MTDHVAWHLDLGLYKEAAEIFEKELAKIWMVLF